MKIDLNFINKIFNLKIKIKKEKDKITLSLYEDSIPMYDIYSQKIYLINKFNLHHRLIDSHYRFINHEIYQWLKNLYSKNKSNNLKSLFKYNLDVISNYDIDTLIETSYKTLYKYSPSLGLQISICKRNSFNPFIFHLKPYYSKLELIKLGQNMHLLKNDINQKYLIDQDVHYNVCKKVSKNDVSFEEIKSHHEHILKNDCISWICFFSFMGSFLFNKYLRSVNSKIYNKYLYGLNKIINTINTSPALTNDYDLYRFIWNDSFLINLNVNDIFIDNGFLSTTRDPFYSPGLNGTFGLVLIKIKVPKGIKGLGLFIENFSLFPKEEEFILKPKSKLKLLSKNDNFTYFHTNPEFERLINRKYEFELIPTNNDNKIDIKSCFENNNNEELKNINIDTMGDRFNIINKFIKEYLNNDCLSLKVDKNIYNFTYNWFDSTNTSSYEKFYYNKMKDGLLLSMINNEGYPIINIELGKELVVNFINKYYFSNINNKLDSSILDLIKELGRIFYYKEAIIFHDHNNFSEFNKNNIFSYMYIYNNSIYSYLKNNKKFLEDPFIDYQLGYWYLDEYFNKEINEEIKNILPSIYDKNITNKELFINVIEKENDFIFYPRLIELMDKNIFKKTYVVYNIYEKLVSEGRADDFKPDIGYVDESSLGEDFKLIFRQPIRRY